jgi:tripartite-type tricarboxylate transporter receptor subunit TctC
METNMKSYWTRRQAVARVCAGTAALIAGPAFAQTAYPTRPIKLIVGFPAGSGADLVFRTAAIEAEKKLGQPIVVENKPGAASVIAFLALKAAAPDGYTIGGINAALWRQPVLEDVPYDPIKDFTYIVSLAENIFSIVVPDGSPFRTWADLLAWGRANPGKVTFGVTPGLRQSAHVFMLEVMKREGVDWLPVGYNASPLRDLLGGELTFSVEIVAGASAMVQSGKARFLAVVSDQRMHRWPNVPTFKELGYPLVIDSPVGLGGPIGMQPHHVKVLHDAFRFAIEQPSMVQHFEKTDSRARYMSTAELSRYVVQAEVEQRELLTRYGFAKKR